MVVAPMAQPAKNAEPVEEYEYALLQESHCDHLHNAQIADRCFLSYEGLPPNFSLLQNMTAGALAGIAVRLPGIPVLRGRTWQTDGIL